MKIKRRGNDGQSKDKKKHRIKMDGEREKGQRHTVNRNLECWGRKRERERERERYRETDRQTERQTDRQTENSEQNRERQIRQKEVKYYFRS